MHFPFYFREEKTANHLQHLSNQSQASSTQYQVLFTRTINVFLKYIKNNHLQKNGKKCKNHFRKK